jgi:hypothetical protein
MLPDLANDTVFLLGGGPSLTESLNELERHLQHKEARRWRIFAINESFYSTVHADLLFFRDSSWYIANKASVDAWSGVVVTTAKSQWKNRRVFVVKMKHCDNFLTGSDVIKFGRSSGHIALSLAIALGAKKCILLGYDCRIVNDKSHFHDKLTNAIALTYKEYFLPAWIGWGDAVETAGVEVVNCTPDSAIVSFPRRSLSEVLTE